MTKISVIDILARKRVIERLVKQYGFSSPYCKDLCQDLYIELLNKEEDLIVGLYEREEIEYYIRKMISNNINSSTSPFYKKYEKFRKKTSEIQNEKTEGEQD
jgi:hypothetical protein